MKLQIDNRIQAAVYAVRERDRLGLARAARGATARLEVAEERAQSRELSVRRVEALGQRRRARWRRVRARPRPRPARPRRAAARSASARPRVRAPRRSRPSASTRSASRLGAPARPRASEQIRDLVPQRHRPTIIGRRDAQREWAARPIFRAAPTHSDLTFRRPRLNNGKAVPLRLAAPAVAIAAFASSRPPRPGLAARSRLQLARALHARHVSPARTGAIVLDLQTGSALFAHNARLPLRPASNEKLATTYAALTALGPSFRIETDVLGEGQQSGTTWQGDLVLKGYGDPALSYGPAQLARAPGGARTGSRHVSGRVLGDESWFDTRRTGLGWKPEFYLHESPALSALIVNRGWTGRVRDEAARADGGTALPARPAPTPASACTARPALGVASAQAAPLADVVSAPLSALVRHMDVVQRQLLRGDAAEGGRRRAGRRRLGRGRARGRAATARARPACRSPGSGSSTARGSRCSTAGRRSVSPTLLRTMWEDPDLRPYVVASLPIAGETGTLEHRMRTAAGARRRPREDGHDGQRVVALGLRRRPLRLLDPRERQPGADAERRAVAEPLRRRCSLARRAQPRSRRAARGGRSR